MGGSSGGRGRRSKAREAVGRKFGSQLEVVGDGCKESKALKLQRRSFEAAGGKKERLVVTAYS